MGTIKIKPSHPSQGEYVIIDEKHFNQEIHQRYEEEVVEQEHPTTGSTGEIDNRRRGRRRG